MAFGVNNTSKNKKNNDDILSVSENLSEALAYSKALAYDGSSVTHATADDFFGMLARFRALSLYYQEIHWSVKGNVFFQDHLLAERLYNEVSDAIDGIAEKGIGVTNDRSFVAVMPQLIRVNEILGNYPHVGSNKELFAGALKFEGELYNYLDELFQRINTAGCNDFFGQLADDGMNRTYLLLGRLEGADI